jgi:hypothetical protein
MTRENGFLLEFTLARESGGGNDRKCLTPTLILPLKGEEVSEESPLKGEGR